VIAILAASIAAISELSTLEPALILLIAIGPLFSVLLCRLAIRICDRSYWAYLEGISIEAKLEPIIGLTEHGSLPEVTGPLLQFSKDEYFLPDRWVKFRHFATAEKFVEVGKKKGANQIINPAFTTLGSINLLLAIGIVVYTLQG
jgi:hypothetical protein